MSRLLLLLIVLVSLPGLADEPELPAGVRSVLDVRQVPDSSLSLYVQDLDSGAVILRWNDEIARNPGSIIKLVTTLAALDLLGPAYAWHTDVYVLGDVEDGRLDGDLLIKGYGDPFLVTERVWQLLRQVRQLGIHDIEGDLLIDDSFFYAEDHDPAAFDRQPLRAYNVAPNALLMNFKVVRYWFEPQHDSNQVRVWLDPPMENLTVDNRLSVAPGACRGYQRGISISANEALNRMTLSGRFPGGCKLYAMDRTALSHNEFAYGLFLSLWRESGGEFLGGWQNVKADDDLEPVIRFPSLPMSDIITRINKHSNNVMARQLLYTLSAEVLGEPGTEAGGREVIQRWLEETGLDVKALQLENGAGLSREARISASDMGALLEYAWRQPYMPEYVSSLALAGKDGTLRRRFDDARLHGSAHLKTGSLDDVVAIAGYLQARSGRRFAVVTLQNHEDIHRGPGQEVQEALLRWVYER